MTIPAVIVGMELNGLGVARSLGEAGVSVIALDTDVSRPTCMTRYARLQQVASLEGAQLIDALLALRTQLTESPVLLLTQEGAVATVSAERKRLIGAYRFSMPDDVLMQRLLNKLEFQALAESLGCPVPAAARLSDDKEISAIAHLRFPCVLKPTTKDPHYARRFSKAYRVASASEAFELWRQMRDVVAEVIVQEWIEGGDSDVYFCLQYRAPDGHPTMSFVGRKLRQWPLLVGGTATCIPAPEAERELLALTNQFFGALGFAGLCSMEFKRDRRDGRFYMVEPTVGRTDFQEAVATLNGKNIPHAAWLGELGYPPPQTKQVRPSGWRDPFGEINARAASREDTPAPGMPLRDAYWSARDPLPFLTLNARRVRRRLGRGFPILRKTKPKYESPS